MNKTKLFFGGGGELENENLNLITLFWFAN